MGDAIILVRHFKTCSHDCMGLGFISFSVSKTFSILFILFSFFSVSVHAQELSLEDETLQEELSNQQSQPQTQNNQEGDATSAEEAFSAGAALETPLAPTGVVDEANSSSDEDEQQVETLEQEYAINGYSVGALLFNHNYNVYANLLVDGATVNLSSRSPDFQSAGIMGRYAILPYGKVGADLNISLATTLNHGSVNNSSITTLRAEVNFGYAFKIAKSTSFYVLAGLGYEVTKGADIENILTPGGGAFQVGGGIAFSKKLNFEFIYSYVSHTIKDKYLETAALAAAANGATVSFNPKDAAVISNVLLGRVTYNY